MLTALEAPNQYGKTKPIQLNLGGSSRRHWLGSVSKVLNSMIEEIVELHVVRDLLLHEKPLLLPSPLPIVDPFELQELRAFSWM
jgi:hypothetical protein